MQQGTAIHTASERELKALAEDICGTAWTTEEFRRFLSSKGITPHYNVTVAASPIVPASLRGDGRQREQEEKRFFSEEATEREKEVLERRKALINYLNT